MSPTANNDPGPPSSQGSAVSGKLVIISILFVAFAAAGVSWGFRFYATHRAAGFWGPQTARLIRNSPTIKLSRIDRGPGMTIKTSINRDVSNAPGITHLRNALLEDKSFDWSRSNEAPVVEAAWRLQFIGDSPNEVADVYFTADLNYTFHPVAGHQIRGVSCVPISAGLLELFTEMTAGPAAEGPTDQIAPAPSTTTPSTEPAR
jgi:hypothetical protein